MKPPAHFLAALALAFLVAPSRASDAEFQALLLARQPAALEALARERLARDPFDEAALWYWGQQAAGDRRQRAALQPRAAACVHERPQSARCAHLSGLLIGAEIMDAGGLGALRRIGEVRTWFERAVALAPADYAMRRDLQAFYLEVPALMGGSARKAHAQAAAFDAIDAARGALLHAAAAIAEGDFAAAERLLVGVRPAGDRLLASDLQALQIDYGLARLQAGDAAAAQDWFERLLKEDPGGPELHAGLGRALLALKQPAAAAAAFERALARDPALRIQHKLGEAWEAAGDRPRAIDAYRRALADPGNAAVAERARERLAALQR